MTSEELLRLLKEKADADGISASYPPISAAAVTQCEKKMGVQLPDLVKLVYTTVSNGGIGPGEAMLELQDADSEEDVVTIYCNWISADGVWEDFDHEAGDGKMEWIPGVLPLCDWGGGVYTVLDCTEPGGRMVHCDITAGTVDFKKQWKSKESDVFTRPGVSFEEWVSAWLDEDRKWAYMPGANPKATRQADQGRYETDGEYASRKKSETDLNKRAASGDEKAMHELGQLYELAALQNSQRENTQKSLYWYEESAKRGYPKACSRMARALRDGRCGAAIDWDRAFAYNANADTPQGLYINSFNFPWNLKDEKFWHAAKSWWQLRAELGDEQAAYSLAWVLEKGVGVAPDKPLAIESFQQAAAPDCAPTHSTPGTLFSDLAADDMISWLRKAADEDDPAAQFKLWRYYSANDRDWKSALKYLKSAAKARPAAKLTHDAVKAMFDLATLHLSGHRVEQDLNKAVKLFERAAKLKHPRSCYQLGIIYSTDERVRNYETAVKWFRIGSEGGSSDCFYQLGLMYEQGLGVQLDLSRSSTLLKIAADQGHLQAEARLDEVLKRRGV